LTDSFDGWYIPRSIGTIGASIHEGTRSPEKILHCTDGLFTHEDCRSHRIRQNQETGSSKDSVEVS
jgi:hypothetical protein